MTMAESGGSCTFNDADVQQLLDEEAATEKTPGWKRISKTEFTEVSRKEMEDDKHHLVKMMFWLPNVPCNAAVELCTNLELRQKWDPHFHHIEVIEQFEDYCCVHWQGQLPTGIKDRDLLQYMWVKKDERTDITRTFVILKAATHPKCPEQKGYIRAQTIHAGLIIHCEPNNSSKITVLAQTDMKGSIPTALSNFAMEHSADKWRVALVKYYTEVYSKK